MPCKPSFLVALLSYKPLPLFQEVEVLQLVPVEVSGNVDSFTSDDDDLKVDNF